MDKQQEIQDMLENALEDIRPDRDELINRRINHLNFARTIFLLSVRSMKDDFIYSSELSEFLKISHTRANQIFSDLTKIQLLKKRFATSNLVEYWFVKENEIPLVRSYFDKAQKTLGFKYKLEAKSE